MNENEVKNALHKIKPGTYVKASWVSELGNGVEKHSHGVVRTNVDYTSMKAVKQAGLGGGPLPGSDTWVDGYRNELIANEKGLKIRLTVTNNITHSAKSYYTLNGKDISKDELRKLHLVAPSRLDPKPHLMTVFTVFIKNLVSLG